MITKEQVERLVVAFESIAVALSHFSFPPEDGSGSATHICDRLDDSLQQLVGERLGHEICMGIQHGLENVGINGGSFVADDE